MSSGKVGGQGERVGVVSFKCSDSKRLEEVLLRWDSTVLHVDIESSLSWWLKKDSGVCSRGTNKVECVELCIAIMWEAAKKVAFVS